MSDEINGENKCEYQMAIDRMCWFDKVKDSNFCAVHVLEKCRRCGNQATHQCHIKRTNICGRPVCEVCNCVCEK